MLRKHGELLSALAIMRVVATSRRLRLLRAA